MAKIMKNLTLEANGGRIAEFTSQYHHESRCSNLLSKDSSIVWFSSVGEPLPQYVVFELSETTKLERVGIFLHGENNQNPKHITISCSNVLSEDKSNFHMLVDQEIEHRAGDFLWDVSPPVLARFIMFAVTENWGGSGIYIAKCFAYGEQTPAA
eukprot:Clim_evm49s203 gene=Clim_evmTU49s203